MILKPSAVKRLVVVGMAENYLFHVVRIVAFDRGNVERAGQVLDHRIEQRLHTLVLERAAAKHREKLHPDGRPAQSLAQLGRRRRLAFEKLVQHLIVVFGHRLDQLHAEGFRLLKQVGRNLFHRVLGAHGLVVPQDGAHLDQVDHALESRPPGRWGSEWRPAWHSAACGWCRWRARNRRPSCPSC